jgi:hypothetical protein
MACTWNSVKALTSHQAWRKLSSAVFPEGALDQVGLTGFYVKNKDTVHKMVLICTKLDPSNPERKLGWVDVEESTNAE